MKSRLRAVLLGSILVGAVAIAPCALAQDADAPNPANEQTPPAGEAGIQADTDSTDAAHGKLSSEVSTALVAVARQAHPLTADAVADVEESGVVVDTAGRLRVAVTLVAPLDSDSKEALDELDVQVEKTSKDGLTLRTWVPAENVEALASLTTVSHVARASSWH